MKINLNIEKLHNSVAYFCPEYGILEGFTNYSGGLGILAGDHIKTAADLNIKLFGVGLMYDYGYFKQNIDKTGDQHSKYVKVKRNGFPIKILKNGNSLKLFKLKMPEGNLFFKIWIFEYNSSFIFFADTDIKENTNIDYKKITDKLYGGGREKRIMQEYLLGYGMSQAISEIGIKNDIYHINEGHAAFALLERIESKMNDNNLSFDEARYNLLENNVFTTHTPVVHGNEVFKEDLVWKYFKNTAENLKLTKKAFLELGKIDSEDKDFSMTVLALKLSGQANAVSKLHQKTAQKMWHGLWKNKNVEEVPIVSITNGVHFPTWISDNYKSFYDRILSKDWIKSDNPNLWEQINNINDEELINTKKKQKSELSNFIENYFNDNPPDFLNAKDIDELINNISNPNIPFIGFARRFAPYKRSDLIFSSIKRLKKIIKKYNFVLFISGKAHPKDTEGQAILKDVINDIQNNNLHSNIVFLENYDMQKGKILTSSCDIWLNNPVRPLEASGTSGMKAAMNGALNLSILDGWWDEAYDKKNGFAFGGRNEYDDLIKSYEEASDLYNTLEYALEIYQNDHSKWIRMVRRSIISTAVNYSSVRMLKEYLDLYHKNRS